MKAAVCRAFGEDLRIEEVEIAAPGADEVLVKVAACAICHSDITYMDGGWGGALPTVYGHEAAGIVEAAGDGVTGMAVGDHVVVTLIRSCGDCHFCAKGASVACEATFPLDAHSPIADANGGELVQGLRTGAFAEYVVVHQSQAVAIDRDVPLDSASLLACGVLTGYGAVVNTAAVPAGSTVAVIGLGGVGMNSVQGARIAGAAAVIAIDLSQEKLSLAETFGATAAICAADQGVASEVRRHTAGRGADFVFVTVGAGSAIDGAFELMSPTGAVVLVGMPESGVMSTFDPSNLAAYNQRILGSKMGSGTVTVDIPELVDLYKRGELKLDELITGRFKLDEINDAIASTRRGDALRNVIVF